MDSSLKPTTWSNVAAVFIALFILTLIASGLTMRHVIHRKKQLQAQSSQTQRSANPHAFGTVSWRLWEDAQSSQADRDAVTIANLEAQIGMLEQAGDNMDHALELVEMENRDLKKQLSERLDGFPVDSEAFQRMFEDVHRPLSSPGARAIPEYSIPQPPPGLPTLQTTKLRGIINSNMGASPRRKTRVEHPNLQVRSRAASLAVVSPLDDIFVVGDEDDVSSASSDGDAGPAFLAWSNI